MATINLFRHARETVSFAARETICLQGQPGDVMYVITAGEVDIHITGEHIATLGVGSIVGEMAFLDKRPRSATVIARSDCALYPIDRAHFEFLVQQTPYFATQVMQMLVERLRDAHTRGVNLEMFVGM